MAKMKITDSSGVKSHVQMLTRTENCPLSFNEWLVYSAIFRSKQKFTAVYLSQDLGLSPNTLTSVRSKLAEHGLLWEGDFCVRTNAPADWFVPKSTGGIASWEYYRMTPECPLKTLTNAALCLCLSYGKMLSGEQLGKQLSIDAKTARKAIMDLEELALLDRRRRRPLVENIPTEWHRSRRLKRDWTKLTPREKVDALYDRFFKRYSEEEFDFYNKDYPAVPETPAVRDTLDPFASRPAEAGCPATTAGILAARRVKQFIARAVLCHWRKPVIEKFIDSVMRECARRPGWRDWSAVKVILHYAEELLEHVSPTSQDARPNQIAAHSQAQFNRRWPGVMAPARNKEYIDWETYPVY